MAQRTATHIKGKKIPVKDSNTSEDQEEICRQEWAKCPQQ